jgi:hypothetical protein
MTSIRSLSLSVAAAALALGGVVAGTAPASAQYPVPEGSPLSQLRQDTVDRARAALNNPRGFKTSSTSSIYQSTVLSGEGRNVLERNGSNANRVVFNDYNGLEWCGYFAAAVWTGTNTPNPSDYPRIPDSYPSSQAWRTGVGSNFHAFNGAGGAKPRPGDVLVWQNHDTSTGGHVGVVVGFNYDTMKVTTIEGNVSGDEIQRKVYAWDSNGPSLDGKTFKGFTDRD